MNTPLSWIRDYVPDLQCTDKEYYDRMTLSGTKVENWTRFDHNCEKIVVGRVEEITRHPDADHLWVCKVNIGTAYAADGYNAENDGLNGSSENCIQIVTSAQNLTIGDVVPVCLNGGRVAGGHDGGPMPEKGIPIKSGKMRGLPSVGMMCGIEELGATRDMYPEAPENGIYVFPKDQAAELSLGSDAMEALGLHDTNFEYEITSNRVDCYSMLGIAREAAVTFGDKFVPPVVTVRHEGEKDTKDYIDVTIEAKDLCSRYVAAVCTDIKLGPSPRWMQRRLANFGIRPINNLVDITNFVMMEYGQPMHAYDYDTIHGKKIIVRRASDGETFTTLDGQERKLDKDVLMICDADRAIGLAGIMGGEDSMITDSVKTVLFEAAAFDGTNIRKSSKRIGLRTDASAIFEKGLDPHNAIAAMDRACQLMEELGCGKVARTYVDVHDILPAPRVIPFEPEKINAYLGTSYTEEEMLEVFDHLELTYDPDKRELTIPTFRQDLKQMCDLSEEVARFKGYDKVPSTLPKSSATVGGLTKEMKLENIARDVAMHYGFSEEETFSFEGPKVLDTLRYPADAMERKQITIRNPLGENFSVMRTQTINGILTSLGTNYARRNDNVRLFDLGKIYLPKSLPLTDYCDERPQLTLGFYGEGDFFVMKGVVEDFLKAAGLKDKAAFAKSAHPFLHPGRQADVSYDGTTLGYLGEVHPEVAKAYGIGARVYLAVVDLPALSPYVSFAHHFAGIAKFPAMTRDISMVVPKQVTAGEIEAVIAQRGGKILESCSLFDLYEGAQIRPGFKSMAYTLTFRNKERTLETEEVDKAMKKVLNGLQDLGIELRG
ncbi:MAG: phenylalanine--tRNA ligase subunit beta [Lachnospiraceae bacterium]|jgi:phenylalanyl-tRNA synthetase beta chain|nr:phenylalanine--tRNA ligase subunit beta [Lachnospiraceae bacterium]MCI1397083.1 phenylalanine--tRNA ligase subunit beta [Lachnospiraceae bacterium]MCI1422909.1 phenylalanine--tRNA ligase subunit beta [Lachnospiraceae bacterium]MCI1451749.1 phenylalanine--tRNA ligase subunit beta [Lachnospiraceae bacterium]